MSKKHGSLLTNVALSFLAVWNITLTVYIMVGLRRLDEVGSIVVDMWELISRLISTT